MFTIPYRPQSNSEQGFKTSVFKIHKNCNPVFHLLNVVKKAQW